MHSNIGSGNWLTGYRSYQDRVNELSGESGDSQIIKFGDERGSPGFNLTQGRNRLMTEEANIFGPAPSIAAPLVSPSDRYTRRLPQTRLGSSQPGARGQAGSISYAKGYEPPPQGGGFASSTPASSNLSDYNSVADFDLTKKDHEMYGAGSDYGFMV